jgi:hypothetical protein
MLEISNCSASLAASMTCTEIQSIEVYLKKEDKLQ